MKIVEQIDREFLRKIVLKFLAERFRLAFDQAQIVALIKRRGMVDFDFDLEDIQKALAVVEGLGLIEQVKEEMGATVYYKITSKGIIENERLNQ
jgi:hypothetical protein